ncbi:vascular-related unknown protein 4-like [Cucurbita maxima]|uniref:Uncharacterized protein n=1 Tax=Cucurbita maxima TaxID=3661 RepID=A0A6J1J018_CUCMA|nr:vascular-related unknown protein 4-like [Cucurbita maxima]
MAKENSTSNSVCHGGNQSPEESGWTIYFQDFLNTNTNHHPAHYPASSSSHMSPDQSYSVADAASSIADHKLPGDNDRAVMDPNLSCKDHINLFKRRKMIKELLVEDEALEDTASSPVNSPKVSDSTFFSKSSRHHENQIKVNERREMGLVGIESEYKELKKRGLCLVPLCMVLNYLAQ